MNIYIDILRIALCLSIVLFHMEGGWLGETSIAGGVSVDGFFVLAGFLHGLPKAKRSLKRIYAKLFLRIVPLLVLSIVVSIGIHAHEFISSMREYGVGYYLVHPGRWVSLIEQYNVALWFMLPYIIFVALTPLYQRGSIWIKSLFIAVVVFFPLYFHIRYGDSYRDLSYNPLCIAWQYGLGVFLGSKRNSYAEVVPPVCAYAMFALVFASGFIPADPIAWKHEWLVSNLIISAIYGAGLLALCNVSFFPDLSKRPPWAPMVALLSGMTYSIFLFHCPILHLGYGHVTSFVLTCVLAYLLKITVEEPISCIWK